MDRCCCRCCGLEACKLKGSNVKVSCSKSHCALRHQAYITSFRGGQFCVLVWNHRLQSVSGAKAYACVTVFRKVQLKGTLQPDSACIGKRFIKQGVKPVVRRWLRNIEKAVYLFHYSSHTRQGSKQSSRDECGQNQRKRTILSSRTADSLDLLNACMNPS